MRCHVQNSSLSSISMKNSIDVRLAGMDYVVWTLLNITRSVIFRNVVHMYNIKTTYRIYYH